MTIRTKLRIGTIATALLIFLFMSLLFFFVSVIRNTYEKQRITEKIAELSFQSSLVREEYLRHPGERPKIQWISLFDSRMRLFQENSSLFSEEPDHTVFEQLRISTEESKPLFQELIRNVEQGGSETIIQELNNQMSIRAQAKISLALQLIEVNRETSTIAAQVSMFAVVIVGILLLGMSAMSYLINSKISRAISMLGKGARIIANGDLTHQLPIEGNDEIAEVSRLFNTMTKELQGSHTELEQKVQERTAELIKSNTFLDTIIENIPNMIFMKEAKDLRFVRLNKASEELLGYKRGELIGKNDFDFFPKQQADFFTSKDREVLTHKNLVDIPEEPIETKLKGTRWLHTKKIPLYNAQGMPEYLLGISEDITERLQADKAKSEFVSLASHQLRTPLTAIRWALSSLAREVSFDAEHKETLEAARKAVTYMAEMIRAMLTIAHIESDELPIQTSDVRICDVLHTTTDLLKGMQKRKDLYLNVQCSESLSVRTDEHLLKEILNNLLSNAYKYTPQGGTVTVNAKQMGNSICIEIQDSGFGIPASEQGRIFQKFFRASNITKKEASGSGLGLYLVYSLVHLLGGDISFISKENIGTTFTLTLPSAHL